MGRALPRDTTGTAPRPDGRSSAARARARILALLLTALATAAPAVAQTGAPHLEKRGEVTQLIVDGRPFLALAGELQNNSATSLEYMKPIWPRMTAMHLNTVLAAVSWAQLEPAEGKFDYTLVDGLVRDARANGLHLVLLWFGSWKNTWSSYAPEWVKRDYRRFPRAQLQNGSGAERLSTFSEANRDADARAFAALMRRIREIDGDHHTVLMIQVENEVGVIHAARDYSPAANAAYARPVPAALMSYLVAHRETLAPELRDRWQAAGSKTSGSWETVFGPGRETEDLFMAWNYARYIGAVTAAGKGEYGIPMYVNAALIRPSYAPGQYASGGPLPRSMDVWRAGAPQLDFLAPDIYFEFKHWAERYDRPGNPLFIPETHGDAEGAANVFYAVGEHHVIGFSPFAIDRGGPQKALSRSYEVLSQLSPLILENQPKGRVAGVALGELTPAQEIVLGDYTLTVTRAGGRDSSAPDPHGIFIASGPDEFYMAGDGLNVTFSPDTPGPPIVGLGTVEEGRFVDGRWVPGRALAGDDTGQGNRILLRGGIQRVTVYRYP
ncbi:MAG TPA: DUF5597 domain-containing protein [Longimicrobiaceae bacterium]|nr:DUF5597 domain-containing protein [Longimicrobiaceae bacterium]